MLRNHSHGRLIDLALTFVTLSHDEGAVRCSRSLVLALTLRRMNEMRMRIVFAVVLLWLGVFSSFTAAQTGEPSLDSYIESLRADVRERTMWPSSLRPC